MVKCGQIKEFCSFKSKLLTISVKYLDQHYIFKPCPKHVVEQNELRLVALHLADYNHTLSQL